MIVSFSKEHSDCFYPNLLKSLEERNIYKLKLYDLFGRLIIEINEISASDYKLKTDFLTSGQYMLEISDESLITHKALIIK